MRSRTLWFIAARRDTRVEIFEAMEVQHSETQEVVRPANRVRQAESPAAVELAWATHPAVPRLGETAVRQVGGLPAVGFRGVDLLGEETPGRAKVQLVRQDVESPSAHH